MTRKIDFTKAICMKGLGIDDINGLHLDHRAFWIKPLADDPGDGGGGGGSGDLVFNLVDFPTPLWYLKGFDTNGAHPPRWIDLLDYGVNQQGIDEGGHHVSVFGSGRVEMTSSGADAVTTIDIDVYFADEDGFVIGNTGEAPVHEGNFSVSFTTVGGAGAPAGTRYIGLKGNIVPFLSLFTQAFLYSTSATGSVRVPPLGP